MPTRASDQRRSTPAPRTPTWPALFNIPRLDRSFAGHRNEKTFTIHGESAAASEGRRYIVMDKSMHVSRAVYVSALEHILYSAWGSAITHVASAHVHTILLACARGEHQYMSNIWLKRNAPLLTLHTRIPPKVAWSPLSASIRVSCSVGVMLAVFSVL